MTISGSKVKNALLVKMRVNVGDPVGLVGIHLVVSLVLLARGAVNADRERVQLRVSEEVPVGTLIGSIPTKAGFTYRLNQPSSHFTLSPTSGELRTSSRLDREGRDGSDSVDLVALSSSPTYPIEVEIIVEDVNDHAPQFPNPVWQLAFSEGSVPGTRAILDSALDLDKGPNGEIIDYQIQ